MLFPSTVWRQLLPTGSYYIVGKMIATCLVQCGQPPFCFAAAVADYLVFDEVKSEPSLNDIPDHTVRNKVGEGMCKAMHPINVSHSLTYINR